MARDGVAAGAETQKPAPANAQKRDPARDRNAIDALLKGVRENALEQTLEACENYLAQHADAPEALFVIGVAAALMGDLATAAALMKQAHEANPNEPLYAEGLAVTYALAGQLFESTYFAKLSAALGLAEEDLAVLPAAFPRFFDAFASIAERPLLAQADQRLARRDFAEAAAKYSQHLKFEPECVEAIRGLGESLLGQGLAGPAAAVLAALGDNAQARDLSLLARAMALLGDAKSAADLHAQAEQRDPQDCAIASAQICDAALYPESSGPDLVQAEAAWRQRFAGQAGSSRPARDVVKKAGAAKIRVGFLCGGNTEPRDAELAGWVAAYFFANRRLEAIAYAHGQEFDPWNRSLKGRFTSWRNTADLDALTLAATIEGDGIDLLLDCAGHFAPRQLAALARRPAPILVSWLGNPIGRSALYDFVLTGHGDGVADSNDCISLPAGLRAFESKPIAASDEPGLRFGASCGLAQLHPDLCSAWAEILRAVPDSVLLLRDRNFGQADAADRLVRRFQAAGVAERIEVVGGPIDDFYALIDVSLAPFVALNPWDDAEALRRGVPLVAREGDGRPRRQASALLRQAGLDRLTARDEASYIALACELGRSASGIGCAREDVRAALASAPLFDRDLFATTVENTLLALIDG
jgi:predicted O-linked N-acetylglucosamine transferase (SPINDLY family)